MIKNYKRIILLIILMLIFVPTIVLANNELVYIDKENIDSKYHSVTCSCIQPNRYTTMPVETAFAQGYRKCPICSAPLSDFERQEKEREFKEIVKSSSNQSLNNMQTNSDNRTVYITKTGVKYHKAGCDTMKSTPYKITVSQADSRGYAPCKVCNPYGLAGTVEENQNNTNSVLILICIILGILVVYLIINDKRHKKNCLDGIPTTDIRHSK